MKMANKNSTSEKASTKDQNRTNEVQAENTTVESENASTDLVADAFKGTYQTSTALNVREQAKPDARVCGVLNVGMLVSCDGRYAIHNGIRYLYIKAQLDSSTTLEGYCQIRFLIKQ